MSRVRHRGGGRGGGNRAAGSARVDQENPAKTADDCYLRGWHRPSRHGVGQGHCGIGGCSEKGGENTRNTRGGWKNPEKIMIIARGNGHVSCAAVSRGAGKVARRGTLRELASGGSGRGRPKETDI